MSIIYIWLGMVIMAALQAPMLFKDKQWKELITFGVMWVLALGYATLVVTGVRILSPFDLISLIYGLLGYKP